jgi:hypothetical protein
MGCCCAGRTIRLPHGNWGGGAGDSGSSRLLCGLQVSNYCCSKIFLKCLFDKAKLILLKFLNILRTKCRVFQHYAGVAFVGKS